MVDADGGGGEVTGVPAGDHRWNCINDFADVPAHELEANKHFFFYGGDFEPGKFIEGADFVGRAGAGAGA